MFILNKTTVHENTGSKLSSELGERESESEKSSLSTCKKQHHTALRTTHKRESKQKTKTKNAKYFVYLFKLLHKSQRITREANGSLIIMFKIYDN